MGRRVHLRSFGAGELSPEFFDQLADARRQTGLALSQNYITLPHGAAVNRPGTRFVSETKRSGSQKSRLIEFQFSETETMVIEMGAGYFRFYEDGAPLSYGTPADYIPNRTTNPNTGINFTPGVYSFDTVVAHGMQTGQRVCITPDDPSVSITSIPQIQFWSESNEHFYYVIVIDSTHIAFATSESNATNNVRIAITAASGSSFLRTHRAYEGGKLVRFASTDFSCRQSPPIEWNGTAYVSATPGASAAYWHQLTPGIYEVPNSYSESELFNINWRQSNDVVTFTRRPFTVSELKRLGRTEWTFETIPFEPTVGTPTNLSVTASCSPARGSSTGRRSSAWVSTVRRRSPCRRGLWSTSTRSRRRCRL